MNSFIKPRQVNINIKVILHMQFVFPGWRELNRIPIFFTTLWMEL